MKVQIQKTIYTTESQINRKWYVVDAAGQTLGRLSTLVAQYLMGKNKTEYVPSLDVGDFVVIINCEKIHVTGKRLDDKKYWHHTGHPGGIKSVTLRRTLETFPDRALRHSLRGMLPKGVRGRQMLSRLKVYKGGEHPHSAQKPEVIAL